ncbi:MAG: 50S ribosomal protein L9 [Candidatus Methylacidiphilales bacterium]|nr:50S ribosomal protein L9 [Candidatus Methylacidiphilales bacterium]
MALEVILKTKIDGLGAEADVVTVKPGYARNYLIPRNLAAVATATSRKQVEDLKRKRASREAEELNKATELGTKLSKVKLSFTLAAGEGSDKVFGSVTANDIAEKLKEQGFEIDKKKVDLPKGLKETGEHEVAISLSHGVTARIKVEVIAAAPKVEEPSEEEVAANERRSKYRSKKANA